VASCHFREDGREVSRPQGKRHSNTQAAAKVTGGQDRFPGHVDLGAGPGCIVPERGPGFGEGSPAGGSRKQLDTKFRLKPEETTADDRLGHAEPKRSRRNPTGIGNLHECLQLFDVQLGVPHFATQLAAGCYYRIKRGNNKILLRATSPPANVSRKPSSLTTATKDASMTFRNGLASLLRPEDSVLVLIDHQPYQLANLNSHDPHAVVNNSTALAKTAKAFGVPTILTSVVAERGGLIFPHITDVFPGQEVIDRTFINTWEDRKVVDAVKATGRKQLVIAGLWTEICVAMPVIQALGEGWDVTVITDASGGTSVEAHEVAIQRMIAAGANMMTWLALASEWQRDWARTEHVGELTEVLKQHVAGSGIAYLWEQQLLNTPVPANAG
jgi:nicotinamidase-related amidase